LPGVRRRTGAPAAVYPRLAVIGIAVTKILGDSLGNVSPQVRFDAHRKSSGIGIRFRHLVQVIYRHLA